MVAIFKPKSKIDVDYSFVEKDRPNQPPSPSIPSLELINSSIDDLARGAAKLDVLDFIVPAGLKVACPEDEIGFFNLIITEHIILFMTQESNKYAHRSFDLIKYQEYQLISKTELNQFLAMIIYMGICNLPLYEIY
jgi:hypothetical protein